MNKNNLKRLNISQYRELTINFMPAIPHLQQFLYFHWSYAMKKHS